MPSLENDYLQYAAERGVPTALALLWMIGWALFYFLRAVGRLPPNASQRWILHAAVAVTIAVLVSGFYSWNLNNSEVLAMFLAVMGWRRLRGSVGSGQQAANNCSVSSTVRWIEKSCRAFARVTAVFAAARGIRCSGFNGVRQRPGRIRLVQPAGFAWLH